MFDSASAGRPARRCKCLHGVLSGVHARVYLHCIRIEAAAGIGSRIEQQRLPSLVGDLNRDGHSLSRRRDFTPRDDSSASSFASDLYRHLLDRAQRREDAADWKVAVSEVRPAFHSRNPTSNSLETTEA